MLDERAPEQKAADDALLEAIQTVLRLANPEDTDPAVVMEYVVVSRAESFSTVERNSTIYAVATKDSGQGPHSSPLHSIIGLLHYGLEYMRDDE